nr:hypothetical protein [Tanacetum cinerariifolium]
MDTTIEQQVAMDEALVPHAQRDMLHICPRVHGQSFDEPPFEEEILAFICFLGHNAAIRTLTDVNINKLYQPWRSFAAIINKCLTGKSSGYDNLRLSQAQILWGLYHKRNVDYSYLMWEDFVYQVEHKNQKKSNEMYYPRFTKVIIHHFVSKDPSIPRRNKVNWHYVKDDHMFSTIKLVSRHQNMQQFGALMPIELKNDAIRNSKAYKEYYAIAIGKAAPKPKASVRRTRSSSDTSITPPTTAASPRLTAYTKDKQTAKASKAKSLSALSEVAMTEAQQLKLVTKRSMQQTHISQPSGLGADEGTGSKPGVPDVPSDESEEELSWNSTDDEGNENEEKDNDGDEEDEGDDGEEGNGDDDDEDDDEEGGDDEQEYDDEEFAEETRDKESFDPIPQTPENSKDEGDGEEDQGLNIGEEERHVEEEEKDELYRDVNINQGKGIQANLEVEDSHVTLTPVNPDGQQQSSSVSSQFVTNFGSLFYFDDRLRSLEANFSEFRQTNQFDGAVSSIPGIVNHYMDQRMNEAVKVAVQIQSDHLRDEAQRENNEFLRTVDENMKKIIKEQVKEQVKVQVSKILPRIEQAVNEQLEAEVLTRSSHSLKTSYAVAADLSEMELKKILIEKIEGNKYIQCSDEQRNLYKAFDEEPSAGPDRGSKRRREGKDPESASAPTEAATRYDGRSIQGSRSRQASASESALAEEPMQTTSHISLQSYNRSTGRGQSRRSTLSTQYAQASTIDTKQPRSTSSTTTSSIFEEVPQARRIIAVTELKIVEWYSYKHLDWITVQRDDDNLYKFKEEAKNKEDYEEHRAVCWRKAVRGRIQDAIKDHMIYRMLLLSFKRSILTDLQVTSTKPGQIRKPYSSHHFIANCFNAGNIKMEVKVPGSSCLTNS